MRKIFESAAIHRGQGVTCAVLGPRTGSVLATGGRDKEICLWTLAERNPAQTMAGFVSQVECVLFSWSELEIAGGNTSGAVKIWDIKKGMAVCSFAGHRGKVKCLAQSQFEDHFWASGAFDGNVKLWDARSSQLVATYRSHSNKTVTCMEFSPDGRWVVTGGEDCVIKLWDIAAGKALSELSGHSGPLTAVQFHPNEYLLASSSQDKTVRFWDMETFECVGQSAPDSAGPVRCILFDPNGRCLYSASSGGGLRVLGWEPSRLFDSESCPSQWAHHWRGVTTLAMAGSPQSVLAACLDTTSEEGAENALTVFSVDATRLRPIYAAAATTDNQSTAELANNNDPSSPPFTNNTPMRRSFHRPNVVVVDSTNTAGPTVKFTQTSAGGGGDDENENDECANPTVRVDECALAFSSRPKLGRSPPNTPVPSDPTTTSAFPATTMHAASDPNLGSTFTVVVAAVAPQRLTTTTNAGTGGSSSAGRLPSPSPARSSATTTTTTKPTATASKVAKNTATVPPLKSTAGNTAGPTTTTRKVVHEVPPQIRSSGSGTTRTSIPSLAAKSTLSGAGGANRTRDLTVVGCNTANKPPTGVNHRQPIDEDDNDDDDCDNDGDNDEEDAIARGAADDGAPNSNFGRTFTLSPDDFIPKAQSSAALSATFTTVFHETTVPSSSSSSSSSFGQLGPARSNPQFPSNHHQHRNNQKTTMTIVSEDDCLDAVDKDCRSMSCVLDFRQRMLSMCRKTWKDRGPVAAVELACQSNDPSVVVDLLNILNFRSNIWKLDLCVAILPQLRELLESKYDNYVHTAVNSLRLVLRGFGQIIKNGLQAGKQVPAIGVDISLEERVTKCQKCYNELLAIRESVQRKNKLKADKRTGRNAHTYRELSLLMNSLDVAA